jgi:uncharacterized protein (TIGR03437 family)
MKRFPYSPVLAAILTLGTALIASAQTPSIDPNRASLNSASFATGQPVAPGSLVSIFGTNLASTTSTASSVPLSTTLSNVKVTFNGIAAPISGVFPDPKNGDQINVQVPWGILPLLPPGTGSTGAVQVVVTQNNVASAPQTVNMTSAAPGIFAITLANGAVVGSGLGQAIAYGNSDGIIAAPAGAITGLATHPAKINDPATLVILATGMGPVDSTVNDGDVPSVITSNTLTKPVVLIGNVQAQVIFSGMVGRDATGKNFGFVGVYQLNVIIAPGTPVGDAVPLQIQMNGITTTNKVTIAVSN